MILETERLTHVYGLNTPFENTALRDINFSLKEGSFTGLIGHTGSGKSTLLKHLNGLLKPSSGVVRFNNQDISADKKFTRTVRFKVGLVFQYPEYQLFEETVAKDIAFGPSNMGFSADEVRERVERAADFTGISREILQKSPFELSGGQKRRVAIAGVIAMQPEVLILDEPTAGLDPRGRNEILNHIKNYHEQMGKTVLLVTHSMEDIAQYSEEIFVLNRGEIAARGTPDEIFSRADELIKMGLAVPQITRVFISLRQHGVMVNPSVYTVEQGAAALLALKKEAAR